MQITPLKVLLFPQVFFFFFFLGGGGGGGGQQASCLVAKQAVEFPQVLDSLYNNTLTLYHVGLHE